MVQPDVEAGRNRTDLELPRLKNRRCGADRRGPATVANGLEGNNRMKMITYAMLALGLMAALPVEANAVVCARVPIGLAARVRTAQSACIAAMAMVTMAVLRSSGVATAITA